MSENRPKKTSWHTGFHYLPACCSRVSYVRVIYTPLLTNNAVGKDIRMFNFTAPRNSQKMPHIGLSEDWIPKNPLIYNTTIKVAISWGLIPHFHTPALDMRASPSSSLLLSESVSVLWLSLPLVDFQNSARHRKERWGCGGARFQTDQEHQHKDASRVFIGREWGWRVFGPEHRHQCCCGVSIWTLIFTATRRCCGVARAGANSE